MEGRDRRGESHCPSCRSQHWEEQRGCLLSASASLLLRNLSDSCPVPLLCAVTTLPQIPPSADASGNYQLFRPPAQVHHVQQGICLPQGLYSDHVLEPQASSDH